MHRVRLTILVSALLLWPVVVRAATVAVVRPTGASVAINETFSRLHGELLSVGFQVAIVDRAVGPQSSAPAAWLQEMATARGADALLDIIGEETPVAVDVWVMANPPGATHIARVAVEPGTEGAFGRLAIRAVEVLRSTFLESDLAARQRSAEALAKPATANVSLAETAQARRRAGRFGLELGGALLTGTDGVGPALLPIVRVGWAARPWLVVQAAAAGLGTRPSVATAAGNARVAQQYAVLGGRLRSRAQRGLRPYLALSVGALRTSVAGQALLPKQGHSAVQWSLLADGGLGVEIEVYDRYSLALAAHVQVAEPYVAIHFADAVVATSGRPNLLLTFTAGAWL